MQIILKILSFFSKACVKRHKPFVVGITGSVGKTSATNFVYQLLKEKYGEGVYKSPYNYNGEFGLPLTILQQKTGGSNPFLWLIVFIKSIFVIFGKKYPSILILEYGIDHVGEMDYMMDIVNPDISVLLNISENHIMQLKTLENIKNEKLKIIGENSKVIFNLDDDNFKNLDGFSYGIYSNANFKVKNIHSGVGKLSFDLNYLDKEYKNLEFNLIGEFQIYNILSMFGVLIHLGLKIEEIIKLSKNIYAPEGRGTILHGINNSIIIDGSYNGGLKSIIEGIRYLENIEEKYYKIAILGDMRELGSKTKEFHKKVLDKLLNSNIDYIILVGEEFKKYCFIDLLSKFGENRVFHFFDSRKAGKKVNNILKSQNKESVIFVKGSQNTIFLEESIKEFCLEKEKTKLVRQGRNWEKIKNKFYNSLK